MRTPQQILEDHNNSVFTNNPQRMMSDYTDDAILINLGGAYVGKKAIGEALQQFIKDMPNMQPVSSPRDLLLVTGDTVFVRWSMKSDLGTITDAVDTMIVKADKIWRQSTNFEICSVK